MEVLEITNEEKLENIVESVNAYKMLANKVNDVVQYLRTKNLSIDGVGDSYKTFQECRKKVFKFIGNKLGIVASGKDINTVHMNVDRYDTHCDRSIICKFARRSLQMMVLGKRMKLKVQ
ncbi:hypothetical protein CHS0354_001416, partial [Potamilus streckersoni]